MTTLNNFGILIAGLFRAPSGAVKTVTLKNKDNNNQNINVFDSSSGGTAAFNDTSVVNGIAQMQVGSGTTPAVRDDFGIETPFANAPENGLVNVTLPGGYNSVLGKIIVACLISPTGGSGTITEVAISKRWSSSGGAPDTFAIFRDIISPGKAFVISQAINLNLEVFV